MYNELNKQLELGFDSPTIIRRTQPRRRRRLPQAGWWFEQIRKMIDVKAPPVSRPVQGRLQFAPTR